MEHPLRNGFFWGDFFPMVLELARVEILLLIWIKWGRQHAVELGSSS